jgi:nicotinamidase-related amidase
MKRPSQSSRPKTNQAPTAVASFGPAAHNSWALGTEGVSLVRKPRRARPLRIDARPQPVQIDLARSALLVVDMQNDFCHPEGWFGQKGVNLRATRKPIPMIARLLPAWRAAGGAVVWLNWGVRLDRLNLPPAVHFKGKRTASGVGYAERSPIDRGRSLVPGDWGAQIVDELPVVPGDITVFKHRLSGFFDNELDSVLRQQGITTLLFTGINTDRCVFSTLQDANFLGYDCVLLQDACSTPSPAYVTKGVLYIVQLLHGFVASAGSLMRALPSASSSSTSSSPSQES